MRRSDHPRRPSAITRCRFSALKTLAIPAAGVQPTAQVNVSAPGAALAGFQVSINGRFWVSTEGHGRTIERAATALATGFIAGIDLSEEMVRMAERRCRRLIRDGKVTLSVGDSDHLPFLDQHFDKALSVHTVYFWADPVAHLREIRRVLADGGRLVLGFRSKEDKMAEDFPESVYTFYTAEEVGGLLEASGFERVDLAH